MRVETPLERRVMRLTSRHVPQLEAVPEMDEYIPTMKGKELVCPDCAKHGVHVVMQPSEGCALCPVCGWSPCK